MCASLWCALLVLPAFWPGSLSAGFVDGFFSRVCHQWDSHSLHLFGAKVAVCARCFAIYAGFLVGALLAPSLPGAARWNARATWCSAVAPMVADVLLDLTPWYNATSASRLLTGGLFGAMAGILLAPLVIAACARFVSPPSLLSPRRKTA